MKIILAILICFTGVMCALAQGKIGQFRYTTSDGISFATLSISDKGFLVDGITSLLKPENSSNIYDFATDGTNSVAMLSSIPNYLGSDMFRVDTAHLLHNCVMIKIDTIYHPEDIVINGFHCHKVSINYLFHPNLDAPGAKQIITTELWVSEAYALNNPFAFQSKNLNGLILRFERRYERGGDYYNITTEALPGVEDHALLQLPPNCKICKTESDFDKISEPILMQKITQLTKP
ncbi:hypothetical protein [Mucilaginibacter boryungensis]|uniref:GLPGLI family protein n=1 Tax=Mucilaginibacter boryungensis TaxID=768480 RepID=A0ABR9XLP7_9SPHI|nr:hypothetical protein [Mucilaginibacter boryungensis]MBE9668316.1 hypothetical protein [Mucilaginibacter boryungensis]